MSIDTSVDRLYTEANEIISSLQGQSEISLSTSASDNLRKALLLGSASYFEHRVCTHVLEFTNEKTKETKLISNLIQNKAINRQYHTWFSWKEDNANSFFGLFGTEFKANITHIIKADETLKNSIKAFMEIGRERNLLVHQDYATFQLEKTLDEIYNLYQSALKFVESIPKFLREN